MTETKTEKTIVTSDSGAVATKTTTTMSEADEDIATEKEADVEIVDEEVDAEANEEADEEENEEPNEEPNEEAEEEANEEADEETNEEANEETDEKANEEDTSQADTGSADDFQTKALERHNYHRRKHGAPDLQWCSKCASQAQTWADNMASSGSFSHSDEKEFGENLFTATSSEGATPDAQESIDSWYDEVKDYTFGEESPGDLSAVGHFTQVVWKETTNVGMAYAVTGNTVYVVANYLPAGNMMGKFHENVVPES